MNDAVIFIRMFYIDFQYFFYKYYKEAMILPKHCRENCLENRTVLGIKIYVKRCVLYGCHCDITVYFCARHLVNIL